MPLQFFDFRINQLNIKIKFFHLKRHFHVQNCVIWRIKLKIGPTGASIGARKKRKSEVNIRRFWVYIWRIWGQKPLSGLTPNFSWWQISTTWSRVRNLVTIDSGVYRLSFPIDFDGRQLSHYRVSVRLWGWDNKTAINHLIFTWFS